MSSELLRFDLLIRGGTVVDPAAGRHGAFDVDIANGRIAAVEPALDAGIRPFTLGADMHGYNVHVPQPGMDDGEKSGNPFFGVAPFNLTIAMSELLALGLDLDEVVATVTANPAQLLRMQDQIGTLAPGRVADVSVLELATGRFKLSDNSGVEIVTERLLRPAWCLAAGERFEADSPLVPPAVEVAA